MVFEDAVHRRIYAAMIALDNDAEPIDAVTLTAKDPCVPNSKIAELSSEVPTSANAEHYAKIVMDHYRRRRIVEVLNSTVQKFRSDEDVEDVLASLRFDLARFGFATDFVEDFAAEWPTPMAVDAFHGPAGEFVHICEPHTESDCAALLVSLLTAAGNIAGPNCYYEVSLQRHPGRLFASPKRTYCGRWRSRRCRTTPGRTRRTVLRSDWWMFRGIYAGRSSASSASACVWGAERRGSIKRGLLGTNSSISKSLGGCWG